MPQPKRVGFRQVTLRQPLSVPEDQLDVGFLQGMVDRMSMGFYNYGSMRLGIEDSIKCVRMRLKKYRETGNTEWLMDAANFCMMEFAVPKHPKAHFRSTPKSESPGAKLRDGRIIKGKEELDATT